jgi:hypothetical protein
MMKQLTLKLLSDRTLLIEDTMITGGALAMGLTCILRLRILQKATSTAWAAFWPASFTESPAVLSDMVCGCVLRKSNR